MPKKKLLIEVDCGAEICNNCDSISYDNYGNVKCDIFDDTLTLSCVPFRMLRHQQCLDAEVK